MLQPGGASISWGPGEGRQLAAQRQQGATGAEACLSDCQAGSPPQPPLPVQRPVLAALLHQEHRWFASVCGLHQDDRQDPAERRQHPAALCDSRRVEGRACGLIAAGGQRLQTARQTHELR